MLHHGIFNITSWKDVDRLFGLFHFKPRLESLDTQVQSLKTSKYIPEVEFQPSGNLRTWCTRSSHKLA